MPKGGGLARDGTSPQPRRVERGKPRPKWQGGLCEWYAGGTSFNESLHKIRKGADGYDAWSRGRFLGTFPSIHDAANAVERDG